MSVFLHLVAAIAGYLLGSIPFGLVLTKLAGTEDIRTIGSGSIGATNVLRTGRKGLAAATVILDSAKGAVAVLIGAAWSFEIGMLAGFAAVIGHLYPVWIGFKGGKGVATAFGTLIVLDWQIGLFAGIVWLLILGVFRISSLAALVATTAAPLFAWMWPPVALDGVQASWLLAFTGALTVLIWIKHASNIQRLLKGEEPRVGARKAEPAA